MFLDSRTCLSAVCRSSFGNDFVIWVALAGTCKLPLFLLSPQTNSLCIDCTNIEVAASCLWDKHQTAHTAGLTMSRISLYAIDPYVDSAGIR